MGVVEAVIMMALVEMVVLLLVMEVEMVMHGDVSGIAVIVMKNSGDAKSGGNDTLVGMTAIAIVLRVGVMILEVWCSIFPVGNSALPPSSSIVFSVEQRILEDFIESPYPYGPRLESFNS